MEERNREEREGERRASRGCLGRVRVSRDRKEPRFCRGGKRIRQRWRERRSLESRGKKGKTVRGFGTRASRDRQIYGTATSFSRRGGLDLTRSCLDTDFAERSRAPNATRKRPSSSALSPRAYSRTAWPRVCLSRNKLHASARARHPYAVAACRSSSDRSLRSFAEILLAAAAAAALSAS